jgi:hypothetical protein
LYGACNLALGVILLESSFFFLLNSLIFLMVSSTIYIRTEMHAFNLSNYSTGTSFLLMTYGINQHGISSAVPFLKIIKDAE